MGQETSLAPLSPSYSQGHNMEPLERDPRSDLKITKLQSTEFLTSDYLDKAFSS